MKNIQIVDGARNATFSVFQATDEEYAAILTGDSDMPIIEEVIARVGQVDAGAILSPLWLRPIVKRDARGIHGTLFYGYAERRDVFPLTMREVDWDEGAITQAQRELQEVGVPAQPSAGAILSRRGQPERQTPRQGA